MNNRLTSRLEGKRILVTGHTGRLGGAFAEGLAKNNQVTGVTLMATDEEFTQARRPDVHLASHGGLEPRSIPLLD